MQTSKFSYNALVTIVLVAIGAGVSMALQSAFGDFPVELFAFPMNVVVAAVWQWWCVYVRILQAKRNEKILRSQNVD